MIKNPTVKTIEKMKNAIENLKKSSKKHNKNNTDMPEVENKVIQLKSNIPEDEDFGL